MPNSILWIGLVVLWVFVLFPMLANRHPRIRRTTDAALATRVLHRGGSKRRRRNGPHDSDPDYRPTRRTRRLPPSDDAEDRMTTPADEPVTDDEHTVPRTPADAGDRAERSEDDAEARDRADDERDRTGDDEHGDVEHEDEHDDEHDDAPRDEHAPDGDPGDDRDADRDEADRADRAENASEPDEYAPEDVAGPAAPRVAARIPPAPAKTPARLDDDRYDEPADTGDEDDREDDEPAAERADDDFVPTRRGRGGYDPEADAIARAARYTFRQRAVLGLLIAGLLCGALGIVVAPVLWWGTGLSLAVLVTYLAYLRKQVRMEEEIRRRRSARLARNRPRDADRTEREEQGRRPRRAAAGMDRDTARTLRRRSVLLEPDDEAPDFEHLETFDPATARALRNRAAEMRRAAGE